MFDPFAAKHLNIPQIEEAMSEDNRHFAREKLGHEPNVRELLIHYISNTLPYKIAHFEVGVPEIVRRHDAT